LASADARYWRMNHLIRILAIDDDPGVLSVLKAGLTGGGVEVLAADDPEVGWEMVRRINPDIVLLDLLMPGLGGMELLDRIVEGNPSIDVVLLTGEYRIEYAVQAIQRGACDYLTKPVDIEFLRERVGKLIAGAQNRIRDIELEEAFVRASQFGEMVGRSPEMLDAFVRLQRIAPHYRSALITGETGTGKELAARALHALSPVSTRPLVVCNCAAIVETLFESELFGHVRGAFTGAVQDRKGMFETANGGAIFLDEVGEIPLTSQSKLLRVLQNQEVQRVGSSAVRNVDVRVIAATNRDLRAMIAKDQFREDLYYRLSMVKVHLPRLVDRKEDLPLLERHFLEEFSQRFDKRIQGITHRAQGLLARYPWPGNVRELENAIGHACMMTAGDNIDVRDLPEELQSYRHSQGPGAEAPLLTLAEAERCHAQYVLDRVGGNKQAAAEILAISRNTLYRILKEPLPSEGHT
jgi:DNA-binding NtrC family response regulator